MSQIRLGMFLLTLMILGFSHKGSYGSIPVKSKGLSEFFENFLSSHTTDLDHSIQNHIQSLFVRPEGKHSNAILILVAYNSEVTRVVREILHSNKTPLIFSVSALPSVEVDFDPALFQFEQNQKVWQPNADPNTFEILPLGKNTKFGGDLTDDEIHQGVILLPEWLDITRPMSIHYVNYKRLLIFNRRP